LTLSADWSLNEIGPMLISGTPTLVPPAFTFRSARSFLNLKRKVMSSRPLPSLSMLIS
jgi:hypothetical protein